MSTALKFRPDLVLARSSRNSGSSGCCEAISAQSTPISPMAAITQLRSATAASDFAAEAAACDVGDDKGVERLLRELFAADADSEVDGALEGGSGDVV